MSKNLQTLLGEPITGTLYEHHFEIPSTELADNLRIRELVMSPEMMLMVFMRAANVVVETVDNQDGTYTHTFTFGDGSEDDGINDPR